MLKKEGYYLRNKSKQHDTTESTLKKATVTMKKLQFLSA